MSDMVEDDTEKSFITSQRATSYSKCYDDMKTEEEPVEPHALVFILSG